MMIWIQRLLLLFLTIASVYIFGQAVWLRWRLIQIGRSDKRTDNLPKRVWFAFLETVKQAPIVKDKPLIGILHAIIFYGFIAFLLVTLAHYFRILFGINLFESRWLRWYPLVADLFAVMIVVSIIGFGVRRFIVKSKALYSPPKEANVLRHPILSTRPHRESAWILSLIFTIAISYLLEMSFSLMDRPENLIIAPISKFLASLTSSPKSPATISLVFAWLHVLTVLTFLAILPYTKHTHIFTGFLNLIFKRYSPSATVELLDLTEERESFGSRTASDLSWKRLFDAFSCIECGRCTQVCPATATLKPLDPKSLIENLRWHLITQKDEILASGKSPAPLVGESLPAIINEDGVWACTTCGACYNACPFDIEHMLTIINLRQGLVLDESKIPSSLSTAYRGIEYIGNPWNMPPTDRGKFAIELGVPTVSEKPDAQWLVWLGCAASYDERAKKVATALIHLLQRAGISFSILGSEERCTGDPARRTGNEYLFQMTAEQNIQTLKKYDIKRIVTQCPHCFHTLKNEYPQLMGSYGQTQPYEVWHHSELLAKLVSEGKLSVKRKTEKITLHDPCYLARHNDIVEEPRTLLQKIGDFQEIPVMNKKQTFCCGAGGGRMWMEEHIGSRINYERTKQALATNSDIITVACPFCLTMLNDGVKFLQANVEVKDIAQLLLDAVE